MTPLKLMVIAGLGLLVLCGHAAAQQNPYGLALPSTARVADRFTPLLPNEVFLQGGMLGARIQASEKNRLLNVDEDDLLDAFERRSVRHQDWQGEHVGKFLHAATLAWAYTRNPALRAKLDRVVARLLRTQEPDGYLGTYPPERRWTSWDVWVHKYDLLGLLTYYQFTHVEEPDRQEAAFKDFRESRHSDLSERTLSRGAIRRKNAAERSLSQHVLQACRRIGDLLIRTFGTRPGQRDINRAGEHMGMAADSVLEPMVLLYRATGDRRYLDFAGYIVSDYIAPGGPAILASLEKYRSVRRIADAKAYEMVSNFNGLLELYRATGDRRLLDDMLVGWNDIVRNRLYITGGASSFECFQDDYHLPNNERSNLCETCVTVTWEQMNLQLLRLTGDPRFADQAERSIYNHLLAAQKPTGDMWSYYTPLEGHKPYGNATNCCLSSGPRGIALIPSFAYMTAGDNGLAIDLYNAGTATTRLRSGRVIVRQKTDFPASGRVTIEIVPERNGQKFALWLRIPGWTPSAELMVSGHPFASRVPVRPGTYASLDRAWRRGDTVTLDMAMPVRVVAGDHENQGKFTIMYGPLVMALDTALNPGITDLDRVALAADTADRLKSTLSHPTDGSGEIVLKTEGVIAGQVGMVPLYLRPYADAGQDGKSRFEVWIAGRSP